MQIRAHERDVGRIESNVGARSDRHADIGLGQRGSVVDAVADHGHHRAARLDSFHFLDLARRQHFGNHPVDPNLPGNRVRGRTRVAGEHDHLEAQAAQLGDRFRR